MPNFIPQKNRGAAKGNAPDKADKPEKRVSLLPTGDEDPAARSVLRLRRLFASERDNAILTAERIHKTVTATGRAAVDAALGDEAADLVTLYTALQTFITTLDPSAEVPNLPDPE